MFGQPAPTGLDVRFSVVGIPIRIHPVFWLTAGFLAWGPDPKYVFVRILCIFLAVMVHELGHAVVTRWFGWRPEIVLYFFGGYATTQRYSTWKDIAVSAAGPAAGFLLYAMFLIGAVALADDQVRGLATSPVLYDAVHFSLFINLVWNLMNLVPVLPLDGGRISQELCCWVSPRNGLLMSIGISVVASGSVAAWAGYCLYTHQGLLGLDPMFLAFMFGYLAYQGVQQLQAIQRGYRP